MTSPISKLGSVALNTTGEAIAFAAGVALAPTLSPIATAIAQEAWQEAPLRAPDAAMLASGVAQGQVDPDKARHWASQHGIGHEAFAALVDIANTGPSLGSAMEAWRRGKLTETEFETALRRASVEEQWFPALKALKASPLEPAQLATAIHRNIMQGADLIVTTPPTTPGKVPQVPPSAIDPVEQAAWSGYSQEKLRVLVGITGLPPGLMEMLSLWNRGEVTQDDVKRAVAQSNLRNEYMDVVLALARQLLTPHEYAELVIRGWVTPAVGARGAAMHGMTGEDFALLSKMIGRPIPIHQVTTGIARGGRYDGPRSDIPQAYLRSLEEGNLRPEWYDLAYANRYTLPSFFVLRQLVSSGAVTEAHATTLFEQEGWPPDLAKLAAHSFAQGAGSHAKSLTAAEHLTEYVGGFETRDGLLRKLKELGYSPADAEAYAELADARRVGSARTQRTGRIRTRYVGHHITEAEARTALNEIPVAESAREDLLADWAAERDVNETQLTQAQVVKAFKKGVWTREQTTEALLERGMSAADVEVLLNEQ